MARTRIAGLLIMALVLAGGLAFAQCSSASHSIKLRVIGVSTLALTDTGPIVLNLYVSADGSTPRGEVDMSKGLKYTVINSPGKTSRIRVGLIGAMPRGTVLRVEAVSSRPEIGTSVLGGIAVGGEEQDIITNIPSCFTDRFAPGGVALRYSFEATQPHDLDIGASAEVIVRYTITEG